MHLTTSMRHRLTSSPLEKAFPLRQNDMLFCKKLVVVVGYLTPSEGWGMAKDHGAPEAGQLPRVWTRGRIETESCQRVSGAKSP